MAQGKHAGNHGITGCFSFYPTKQITTGEGGVVISNDEDIIEKVKTAYKTINISNKSNANPSRLNIFKLECFFI